ncbi:MAG: D-glycerate dehydrogenase [Gemmatimonadetes bacterium]|nr:D-glycerate dehydrogenase [Gemmatimonadota bacterium]
MLRPSILVTRRLPAPIETVLRERYRATLSSDDRQLTRAELGTALREFDVVLCTLGDRLDAGLLEGTPRRTVFLANFGVGTNHIDLAACRRIGMPVSNTPGVLTEDTADLTMLLLLAVARRAWEGDRELRAGAWTGWRPTHMLGTRVSGKTLGIVGMGRIGRAVSQRARQGFGMSVAYWSRTRLPLSEESQLGVRWCDSRDDLLSSADFVSLHCPATEGTRHLIDGSALSAMRRGAFLVNTARGDVVNESALLGALDAGQLAGAALDVFDGEPAVNPALLAHPHIVTLPHLGSATIESRVAMGERVLANIAAWVAGEPLPDRVA